MYRPRDPATLQRVLHIMFATLGVVISLQCIATLCNALQRALVAMVPILDAFATLQYGCIPFLDVSCNVAIGGEGLILWRSGAVSATLQSESCNVAVGERGNCNIAIGTHSKPHIVKLRTALSLTRATMLVFSPFRGPPYAVRTQPIQRVQTIYSSISCSTRDERTYTVGHLSTRASPFSLPPDPDLRSA